MSDLPFIRIRDFTPADQVAARGLILAGLGEHWGWIDETLNPDLDDIAAHYAGETFLLVVTEKALIGTGALIREGEGVGRIVRMSVAAATRRAGVGTRLLHALLARARGRGFSKIVLETTATWHEVIRFYERNGFTLVEERDGNAHFVLTLRDEVNSRP
jgi:GNAT superfamily N-acetyltransferase